MVNHWVENGVSQGQILKWEEPYRVVPHKKVMMIAFQINKNFDVMTSFGDVFNLKTEFLQLFFSFKEHHRYHIRISGC
jgi:hypothetical protein